MINLSASSSTSIKLGASVAALAIVASACGSDVTSTDPAVDAAIDTPISPAAVQAADEVAADSGDAGVAGAEATDSTYDESLVSRQFIPASSAELPCVQYNEATEYPIGPCDSGGLVHGIQVLASFSDPEFVVDGLYGPNTIEFVQELQRSHRMFDTGYVDAVLLEVIDVPVVFDGHADDIDDVGSNDDGAGHSVEQLVNLCNSYQQGPGDAFNFDLFNDCNEIGIEISADGEGTVVDGRVLNVELLTGLCNDNIDGLDDELNAGIIDDCAAIGIPLVSGD